MFVFVYINHIKKYDFKSAYYKQIRGRSEIEIYIFSREYIKKFLLLNLWTNNKRQKHQNIKTKEKKFHKNPTPSNLILSVRVILFSFLIIKHTLEIIFMYISLISSHLIIQKSLYFFHYCLLNLNNTHCWIGRRKSEMKSIIKIININNFFSLSRFS